jgi:hypothetical protein
MRPGAKFKLTEAEWGAVKAEMRALLIEQAKTRQTISYSELADRLETVSVHPYSYAFARLLTQIGGEEEQAGRPLLPALVVRKATGIPGAGYFKGTGVRGHTATEEEWAEELQRVYDYWSR